MSLSFVLQIYDFFFEKQKYIQNKITTKMAKTTTTSIRSYRAKAKKKLGKHSKKKQSNSKRSKNYHKAYRGQGR
jgi:hypothetical protein